MLAAVTSGMLHSYTAGMTNKLIPDPDLEQLVRELNQAGGPDIEHDDAQALGPAASWPLSQVRRGEPLEGLLIEMAQRGASDLLIVAGAPPVFRLGGWLVRAEKPALDGDEIAALLGSFMSGRLRERVENEGAADFSLRLGSALDDDDRRAWRFRVNIHRQRGGLAASIRALPLEVPTLGQLGLPMTLAELVHATSSPSKIPSSTSTATTRRSSNRSRWGATHPRSPALCAPR